MGAQARSSHRGGAPRWQSTGGNGQSIRQIWWPPPRSSRGRQRSVLWPSPFRISWPLTEVPADLLDRIRDGIEQRLLPPQWNGPPANIEEHRIFVVGRRTVGADDGLPLRRAIFAGEYGRGPAMAVPPAGVGASRCPLSCAWPRPTERCLCSGQSDDLWFRTTPTTGAERQRASHWQTQHRTDAAKLGQPRPGQPVGLPVHNPLADGASRSPGGRHHGRAPSVETPNLTCGASPTDQPAPQVTPLSGTPHQPPPPPRSLLQSPGHSLVPSGQGTDVTRKRHKNRVAFPQDLAKDEPASGWSGTQQHDPSARANR
jgi:hypothetical protein